MQKAFTNLNYNASDADIARLNEVYDVAALTYLSGVNDSDYDEYCQALAERVHNYYSSELTINEIVDCVLSR